MKFMKRGSKVREWRERSRAMLVCNTEKIFFLCFQSLVFDHFRSEMGMKGSFFEAYEQIPL